jgi:hypothetical protein
MLTVGIWNDQQIPYVCPRAWSVALQIFRDAKLDLLVYNGDFGDYRTLTTRYPLRYGPGIIAQMSEELERQRTMLTEAQRTIRPKKARWNDGNHEFRIPRSFWNSPHGSQLLGIKEVRHATSVEQLLGLDKHKISYSGEYPAGTWVLGGGRPLGGNDCYITHGTISSKKAGATANRTMDDMMCNVVVGHCERLALTWKHAVGWRDYFAVENGNLSLFSTEKGNDILTNYPFNRPDSMNKAQGLSILYHDNNQWWPYIIRINQGRAHWDGKLYKD